MRPLRDVFRRLRHPRGEAIDKAWAGRSLEASIATGLLLGMIFLQGIAGLVALIALGLGPSAVLLAGGHIAMIVLAIAVVRGARGKSLLVAGSWLLFVADWASSPTPESPLLFAACWMCNLASALPALLLRGRIAWQLPIVATALLPTAMLLVRPEWSGLPLVGGVPVTLLAITLATRIGVSYLVEYTDAADAETHALESRTAALTIHKAAILQAAEDARVLHDTAINTLGAIASGGAAIDDRAAVRQRCLADIEAIETLRSARADDLAARPGLRDATPPAGIRVRHLGLVGPALAELEALLPTSVLRALSRAAGEAVQNAARHSGADEVELTVLRDAASVRMDIRDRGVGMSKDPGLRGGVARSILARAADVGIVATVDSAPGHGTTVSLRYALSSPKDARQLADGTRDALVQQLRMRAVFALSAGLVGVGIALAALNHPGEATPEWGMVLVVAIACGLAWRGRHRQRLPAAAQIVLIAAGPLAFVLSAWAVGFGRTQPYLWQAVGPTGPLLVLLIAAMPRAMKVLGFAAYALTVAMLSWRVASTAPQAALVILMAGVIGLSLPVGVQRFVRELSAVATRVHAAQRKGFEVGLEMAAVDAASASRLRWRSAGLEAPIALLRALGQGRCDPGDPVIRQRCADEESFLRQLSLLDPELIQMGTWFTQALNRSRQRGIVLTVRAGAADASAEQARQFGETLLSVVETLPSGTSLTTALFAGARGPTMTLVAPTPSLVTLMAQLGAPARAVTARTLGRQDLVEIAAHGVAA